MVPFLSPLLRQVMSIKKRTCRGHRPKILPFWLLSLSSILLYFSIENFSWWTYELNRLLRNQEDNIKVLYSLLSISFQISMSVDPSPCSSTHATSAPCFESFPRYSVIGAGCLAFPSCQSIFALPCLEHNIT